MEAFFLRISSDLPGAFGFLGTVGGALLVLAGLSFALGRTRIGRFLATGVDRTLGGLVAALLLAMVFLSGLQIVLRNFFDSGLLWIDPLLRHLVLLLAFTGAVLATGAKRHVQINVLGRLLRGRAARIGGAAVAVVAGSLCVLLTHAALQLLAEEIEFGDVAFLSVPAWIVALVFPMAFAIMGYRFYLLAFAEAAGTAPRSAEEAEADAAAAAAEKDEQLPGTLA